MHIEYSKHTKYKNGFTLVELLAVLIILSVILSITAIKTINVLKENRRKTFEVSIANYVRAASLEKISRKGIQTYRINNGEQTINVDYNGDISTWDGLLQIYNDDTYRLAISNGEFCATSLFDDKNILVFDGDCEEVEYYEDNPTVAMLEAKKNITRESVLSGTWSDQSLLISITGLSSLDIVEIKYCIDTENTCEPNIEYTEPFTHYTEGTRYIRYQVKTIIETQSAVETFVAIIDTSAP